MPNIDFSDIEDRLDELALQVQRIIWRFETQTLALLVAEQDDDGSTWS